MDYEGITSKETVKDYQDSEIESYNEYRDKLTAKNVKSYKYYDYERLCPTCWEDFGNNYYCHNGSK